VLPTTQRDLDLLAALPDPAAEYRQRYGVKQFLKGLQGGAELRAAAVLEPTCTICGLTSGYQGPGSKTVLPARASAKVDFRLVPNQTPEEVFKLLRAHLDAQGFSDVQTEFLGGESPDRTDPDHPFVKLVVETAAEVYQRSVQVSPSIGGSGPNHVFTQYLHLPIVGAGISYPGSQIHAPNENLRLDLYLKGARHIARILKIYGEQ